MNQFLYFLVFVLFVFSPTSASETGKWGYKTECDIKGPAYWSTLYPLCGSGRQSPINIRASTAQYDKTLQPIVVESSYSTPENVSLEKHIASIYLKFSNNSKIKFGDSKCLKPMSIHWHWGSSSDKGSEHLLDGKRYPIEGHIVSYNCELYTNESVAKVSENGLYVIGIFYKLGAPNPVMQKVLSNISSLISGQLTNVTMEEITPKEILSVNLNNYFQYYGSLTTPPCTENVLWTVLREELEISEEQLKKFRELKFLEPLYGNMVDNFRPVEDTPTNKKTLYSSFKSGSGDSWTSRRIIFQVLMVLYVMASGI